MSKMAEEIGTLLKECFSGYTIYPEYFVDYKGQGLFFDFFIKELNVCIEVQGEQHYKHVRFFHLTKRDFRAAQYRDHLKREYAKNAGLSVIYINKDNQPTSFSSLTSLITRGIDDFKKDTI